MFQAITLIALLFIGYAVIIILAAPEFAVAGCIAWSVFIATRSVRRPSGHHYVGNSLTRFGGDE